MNGICLQKTTLMRQTAYPNLETKAKYSYLHLMQTFAALTPNVTAVMKSNSCRRPFLCCAHEEREKIKNGQKSHTMKTKSQINKVDHKKVIYNKLKRTKSNEQSQTNKVKQTKSNKQNHTNKVIQTKSKIKVNDQSQTH
jgi:hypothetical protein